MELETRNYTVMALWLAFFFSFFLLLFRDYIGIGGGNFVALQSSFLFITYGHIPLFLLSSSLVFVSYTGCITTYFFALLGMYLSP